jgi:hypothetical protein
MSYVYLCIENYKRIGAEFEAVFGSRAVKESAMGNIH